MPSISAVHDITYHPGQRMGLFRALSVPKQAATFARLSPHIQQHILTQLKDGEVVDLLDQMDLQRAETVLANIKDSKRRKKIVSRLQGELKEKADYFLRFHPKAAISLLNFNYILLPDTATIGDAANAIDKYHQQFGKFPEVLVHDDEHLIGEIPFSAIIRVSKNRKLKTHIVPIERISYQADIHKVVNVFKKSRHKKVAVLDKDESVIGIIYSDDVLAIFNHEPTSALYDFAGVAESERSFDSIGHKVRNRYKWLIVNLGTAFLAASVVGLFEHTLSQLVILAVYMPLVAGMGGNAATQTLAVIVRGITVGEIRLGNGMPAILREVGAGFVNGAINGVIVGIVATLWNGDPLLGLVLAISMIINLVIAGFFGATIPLIMKALRQDPATSATIFITTATDVFGFFAFLGLATLILL